MLFRSFVGWYTPQLATPTGPWGVGRTTLHWVDKDRPESWTPEPDDRRKINVVVWHPAEKGDGSPAPYLPDADRLPGLGRLERLVVRRIQPCSRLGAAPAGPGGPRPVILFSPGGDTPSYYYASVIEDWVSQGWIVVGVEHAFESKGRVRPDGSIDSRTIDDYRPPPTEGDADLRFEKFYRRRAAERAADLGFVLDQLVRLNNDDPLLRGRLDLAKVVAAGHSIGGVSALQACAQDGRFKGGINFDGLLLSQPCFFGDGSPRVRTPWIYLGKPLRPPLAP